MEVKQLIKELQKLPRDAEVLIPNRDLFIDGYYAVTEVDDSTFLGNAVVIDTNYELRKED